MDGAEGGVGLQAMQPNRIRRPVSGVASKRTSVAVAIVLIVESVDTVGVRCRRAEAAGTRGFATAAEEIAKVLAAIGEVAGILDHRFGDHHRSMFGGSFEHSVALALDHRVGRIPTDGVIVAARTHEAIDLGAFHFSGVRCCRAGVDTSERTNQAEAAQGQGEAGTTHERKE